MRMRRPRLVHDRLHRELTIGVRANAPELERLTEQQNLRERRPQLVRHARREVRAKPRQLVLASELQQARRRREPP
jgi:hypothetical protein